MSTGSNFTVQELFIYNFKRILAEQNYTQRSLADAMGVHSSSINVYLTGKRFPQAEKLQELSDFLRVPVADFFKPPLQLVREGEPDSEPLAIIAQTSSPSDVIHKISTFAASDKRKTFGIRVSSDSMAPQAFAGDVLRCILPQKSLMDGAMTLSLVHGSLSLCRVFFAGSRYMIVAPNAAQPIYVTPGDLKNTVLAIVVSLHRDY